MILWAWYTVLGHTELAGRLLSAILGVLTIPAIYWLGRECFGRRVGLLAASLGAVNYFLVYYSQENRPYAMLALLATLSLAAFIRAIKSPSRSNLILYSIVSTALVYTHIYGLVAVIAQAACWAAYVAFHAEDRRARLRRGVAVAAWLVVSTAPLVPLIRGSMGRKQFWMAEPPWHFAWTYMVAYAGGPAVAALLVAALGAAVAAALRRSGKATGPPTVLLLSLWILVSYLLPYARSVIATPCMLPRYTISVVPAILVLVGFGLTTIPRRWVLPASGMVLALALPPLLLYLASQAKDVPHDYRGLARHIARVEPEYPAFALKFTPGMFRFYLGHVGSGIEVYPVRRLAGHLSVAPYDCFWLLDGFPPLLQTDVRERLQLRRHRRIDKRGTVALLVSSKAREEAC
jgi:uncharacterized membrane protein